MESSGFFDATLVDETYDRVYAAAQFAGYFACFIGNGVFLGQGQALQVTVTTPATLAVNLLPGRAWINGYWYSVDSTLPLTLELSDAINPRIDTIILRHDTSARKITAEVITGTPSASPTAPALVRNADYYDLKLAEIRVNAGAITISPSMITDTRPNSEVCGWVSGLIDQVDTTALFTQFQAALNDFITNESATFADWSAEQRSSYEEWAAEEQSDFEAWETAQQTAVSSWISTNTAAWQEDFDEWFASVQDILDEDVAGNLTQAVNELDARTGNLEKMVIKGRAFAPLATDDDALIATNDNYVILLEWKL